MYKRKEVFDETLKYFNGDELATNAWINKYALKDSDGNLYEKSPTDMHWRLAKEFERIELKYPNSLTSEEIFSLLDKFKYIIPQGSPMAGIGNNNQIVSLSNCFVIGNDSDSYGGIFLTDQEQAQLMKRRGGVGHDISHLRPKKMPVNNSALTATGAASFMHRFSNTTREVAQDGRRGALMLTIHINHPDVIDFIDMKIDRKKVTGANISVKITDEFMNAVKENKKFNLRYPIYSNNIIAEINAKGLWNKIIKNAWASAEPGVLFWDTIKKESVADCYEEFQTISTNPCSEIPLSKYDSCRLLAINLFSYVIDPFTQNAIFDWNKFKKHVRIAQKLSDDIVELEIEKVDAILEKIKLDPEPKYIKEIELQLWNKIKDAAINGRRTGLGITAEGDMLAALNLRYGTSKANSFSEELHKTLAINAYESSIEMSRDRGSFKVYDKNKETNNIFLNRLFNESKELKENMEKYGRRNVSLLTIAPVGTVSLMTRTTSGIEPVFQIKYRRRRKVNPNDKDVKITFVDEVGDSWEEYNVFHPQFQMWCEINNYDPTDSKIFEKSPYYKATSADVDWIEKVKMQGRIQKWIDHSISVTINVPENTSIEMVDKLYKKAWESGCKGVTIYREGSRTGVLISDNKKENDIIETAKRNGKIIRNTAPKRPKNLDCDIYHTTALGNQWVVLIGMLDEQPYEVFAFKKEKINLSPRQVKGRLIKSKSGFYSLEIPDVITLEDITSLFSKDEQEALTRMISTSLRHGVDPLFIFEQLDKAEGTIQSFSKAIGRTLKKYINRAPTNRKCPDCNDPEGLIFVEGCVKCKTCGFSQC